MHPVGQYQLMEPDDFIGQITKEVDDYFEMDGLHEFWASGKSQERDPEEVKLMVLNRLMVGYYNELYIRDAVMDTIVISPDVKTQQALMQQAEDEHKHAIWLSNLLNQRGYDPRLLNHSPSTGFSLFWDYVFGRLRRTANIKQELNFLNVISTTQLVIERLTGLHATAAFAESIAPYDEEVAELYGNKIRKDEIFHTINLPEMILKKHATTLEAQNMVRDGVERCKPFLHIIKNEMKALRTHNYEHCKI